MKTVLRIVLVLLLASCSKNEDSFPDVPQWLAEKIETMSSAPSYAGTVVWGYSWNSKYYYHISIPVSSCAYCEVYNFGGERVTWSEDTFSDFLKNGKLERKVWERGFN